jgi:hypothetical protein
MSLFAPRLKLILVWVFALMLSFASDLRRQRRDI